MRDLHPPSPRFEPPRQPRQASLATLPTGIDAIVVDILETPDLQRCAEMGFFRGAHVKMLNAGDPSLISLNDSRLAISRRYLANVLVSYFQ